MIHRHIDIQPSPTPWRAGDLAAIAPSAETRLSPIDPAALPPILPGIDLWDMWPLQDADGATSDLDGWTLWFVLAAPALPDPEERHHIARIRLLASRSEEAGPAGGGRLLWHDNGWALPEGFCPGSREWAGSALFDPATRAVTLYWTASGRRGEPTRTVEQRLFAATGTLTGGDGAFAIADWQAPRECVAPDGRVYVDTRGMTGEAGAIKGFRDPAHWRDPRGGRRYLLFTGSLAESDNDWNGCIGIAEADGAAWRLLPPVVSADLLNNELERPHIVSHGGRLYLFWSTQRKVFAAGGPAGPTGLYAMVADRIEGPWRPVNGSGLVAAVPETAPYQCYSWWVSADLTVAGFADYPGVPEGGQIDTPAWRRATYGGTPAPLFRITLAGDRAGIDHAWQPPVPVAITGA